MEAVKNTFSWHLDEAGGLACASFSLPIHQDIFVDLRGNTRWPNYTISRTEECLEIRSTTCQLDCCGYSCNFH